MQWSLELRRQAVDAVRNGASSAAVSRRLGIPVGTIGWWVHEDRSKRGELPGRRETACAVCDGAPLDGAAYSYLLGQYLGDGHVVFPRQHRVGNLAICCADSWPGIMDATEAAMRAVFPGNSTCRVRRVGCTLVKVYSKHLRCLFPQHGPGMKHTRKIAFSDWQRMIVDEHPWELIRGLIHSDGCRVTNWTTATVAGERKRFEYPRYFFTNKSDDIRRIYCDALDRVGVEWKVTRRGGVPYNISVARKASVALMDAYVGPKY